MSENKKRSGVLLHIATPLFLAAVCAGTAAAAAIKPWDKLKVYVNIAFMDNLKSDPAAENNGLVIKDNNISTEYSGATSETGEVERPAFGEQCAVISTDIFEVDIPVYWGTTTELLEHGACQSSSSAIVGTEGNTVISAHVDTFFTDLDKLKVGDTVTVSTKYGRFTYTVKRQINFPSTNRTYITPTDDTRLTLYTCKRDILGASDMRVGVVCELTESSFYTEKEAE